MRVSCSTRERAPREGKPVTSPVGPRANDITRRARSQAQGVIYGTGWRPAGTAPELFQMWLGRSLQLPWWSRQCWAGRGERKEVEGLGQRSWGAMLLLRGLCPCFSTLALEESWGLCSPRSALARIQNSGSRGAQKAPPGGFALSASVHTGVWARGPGCRQAARSLGWIPLPEPWVRC